MRWFQRDMIYVRNTILSRTSLFLPMAPAPHCSMGPGIESLMTHSVLRDFDEDLQCRQKAMWLLFQTLSVCMFRNELSKRNVPLSLFLIIKFGRKRGGEGRKGNCE